MHGFPNKNMELLIIPVMVERAILRSSYPRMNIALQAGFFYRLSHLDACYFPNSSGMEIKKIQLTDLIHLKELVVEKNESVAPGISLQKQCMANLRAEFAGDGSGRLFRSSRLENKHDSNTLETGSSELCGLAPSSETKME